MIVRGEDVGVDRELTGLSAAGAGDGVIELIEISPNGLRRADVFDTILGGILREVDCQSWVGCLSCFVWKVYIINKVKVRQG